MSWAYLIKIVENGSAVSIVLSNSLLMYSPDLANVTAQILNPLYLSIFSFCGKESDFPQVNEIVTAPYEITTV